MNQFDLGESILIEQCKNIVLEYMDFVLTANSFHFASINNIPIYAVHSFYSTKGTTHII